MGSPQERCQRISKDLRRSCFNASASKKQGTLACSRSGWRICMHHWRLSSLGVTRLPQGVLGIWKNLPDMAGARGCMEADVIGWHAAGLSSLAGFLQGGHEADQEGACRACPAGQRLRCHHGSACLCCQMSSRMPYFSLLCFACIMISATDGIVNGPMIPDSKSCPYRTLQSSYDMILLYCG